MPQGCLKGGSRKPRRGIELHREASGCIKEASKRPQGGLKEAPRCLKEAYRKPLRALRGHESHREASIGNLGPQDASRRP